MGFDDVGMPAQQELNLTLHDVDSQVLHTIPLEFVKFQNVSHLTVSMYCRITPQIFIEGNHGNKDATHVSYLAFYGIPLAGLDLSKLKKLPRRRQPKPRSHITQAESNVKKASLFQEELIFQVLTSHEEVDVVRFQQLYYQKKLNVTHPDNTNPDYQHLLLEYVKGLQWVSNELESLSLQA